MKSESDDLKDNMILLYDRMVETGWLKGYVWKGDAAVLEFTFAGNRATEMLNRILPKKSTSGEIAGFLGFVESIVKNFNDPRMSGGKFGVDSADLIPFCAEDEKWWTMQQPWTREGYTYATNAVTLVRVPARPYVPDNADAPGAETARLFERFFSADAAFEPMPELPKLSPPNEPVFVSLAHRTFKLEELRKIARLPTGEIAPEAHGAEEPMPFRFAGEGCGLLMPARMDDDSEDEPSRLVRKKQAPD